MAKGKRARQLINTIKKAKMKNTVLKSVLFSVLLITVSSIHGKSKISAEENLSNEQQSLVRIAVYTAKGDLSQLKTALNAGLDSGLTINEIKEGIVHAYAYAGFPRSIRGLQTLMEVLEDRKAKGIEDQQGSEASPINDDRDKYKRGQETLYELTGTKWEKPKSGYGAFSPAIDGFLKEHLFADIFERDVLNYQQRQLITISVLSAIGGVEPMLKSHMEIGLNVGLTPEQLQDFVSIIESISGKEEAKIARKTLEEILKNKQ